MADEVTLHELEPGKPHGFCRRCSEGRATWDALRFVKLGAVGATAHIPLCLACARAVGPVRRFAWVEPGTPPHAPEALLGVGLAGDPAGPTWCEGERCPWGSHRHQLMQTCPGWRAAVTGARRQAAEADGSTRSGS